MEYQGRFFVANEQPSGVRDPRDRGLAVAARGPAEGAVLDLGEIHGRPGSIVLRSLGYRGLMLAAMASFVIAGCRGRSIEAVEVPANNTSSRGTLELQTAPSHILTYVCRRSDGGYAIVVFLGNRLAQTNVASLQEVADKLGVAEGIIVDASFSGGLRPLSCEEVQSLYVFLSMDRE